MSQQRVGKYRHVFGKKQFKEVYDDLRLGVAHAESYMIKANKHFIAFPYAVGSGGCMCIWDISKPGRIQVGKPEGNRLIMANTQMLDFCFNPFDDFVFASGCDDATVKLWTIPKEEEWSLTQKDANLELSGHQKKVHLVDFHPLASNLLVSTAFDNSVKLWDIEAGKEAINIDDEHKDCVFSFSWKKDGTTLATISRDKCLRICDPRSNSIVSQTVTTHVRGSRVHWMGDRDLVITVGQSKISEREIAMWDIKNLDKPLQTKCIDSDAGTPLTFYDDDINVLWFGGRGVSNIKFFEITDHGDYITYLNAHLTDGPMTGLALLHKTVNDVKKNEIASFLKLGKNDIQRINFTVPRKSEYFQDDVYPDTHAYGTPSLTGQEWLQGNNKPPVLISLRPEGMIAQSEVKVEVKKAKYDAKEEIRKALEGSTVQQVQVFNQFEEAILQYAETDDNTLKSHAKWSDEEDDDW